MKSNNKVSIVVPMYNSERFIANCIDSLRLSTYDDIEILVVDDGSTDKSAERANHYVTDDRVKLYCLSSNQGVANARNVGIMNATGRYIAFCDSDDIWMPEKLEHQIRLMTSQKASVSHTSVRYITSQSEALVLAKSQVNYSDMRIRNWIANSSGVYDTHTIGKIYQQRLRHEDYAMWCEALRVADFSVGVHEPMVYINRREGSLSANKIKSIVWHLNAQKKIFDMSSGEVAYRLVQNVVTRAIRKF